jgi:hypothetical protein
MYHLWYLLSMRWVVEYYEQADTTQPAEEFLALKYLNRRNSHEPISSTPA